jgi:hypothetical protein
VIDEAPEGGLPNDLPSRPAVFAPDYAPEEIAEIARKLRATAGLPKEPTGDVANGKAQALRSTSASRGRTSKASSSRSHAKRTTKPRARAKSK